MHDIEILAQKQHAHNGAPGRHIEHKVPLFSIKRLNKTDVLIMKIKDKLHTMTSSNVRKKILNAFHFKWTILIKAIV